MLEPNTGFYTSAGSSAQSFDFYPAESSAAPAPLFLYVHGGAWRFGDKSSLLSSEHGVHRLRDFFSRAGFACASINYRLSDKALFPAQIQDVKAAIRFFRAHANEFGIDPQKIVLCGSSAGGHLTLLAAGTGHLADPYFEGESPENAEVSSDVAAAISIYGVDDLRTIFDDRVAYGFPYDHPDDDGAEWRLLGSTFPVPVGDDAPLVRARENWERAHPIDLARYASAHGERRFAPTFFLHGTADTCVPPNQSVRMFEALQHAGVSSSLLLVPEADHADIRCYADPHLEEIVSWTQSVLEL